MSEKVFVTENGTKLKLKPVREPLVRARMRAIEAEYRKEHPELAVPEYKARTIGGDEYDIPLDANSLEDPSDATQTRINKARWAKHEAALKEWQSIQTEQEYLTWLMLGVECDLPDGWESEIEALGINLPEDPLQRKALWLHYMALSVADLQLLRTELQIISVGSVITDDQVESFRSGARRTLEREARTRFADALEALESGEQLVGGAEAERADDGASVAPDTERVG